MGEPQRVVEPTSERLTWDQIRIRFPAEWVCLVEADWIDEDCTEFRTAIVAGHGPDRDDPLDQARLVWDRYEETVHRFTGPIRPSQPLYLR